MTKNDIMDEFFHVRMLIGIILGLSVTHVLKGAVKPIQHPKNSPRIYWVHYLWAAYIFLMLIHFWWWEFKLRRITVWTFDQYLLLILFAISFFLLCALLFPDDISEYKGYKEYFYSRKGWFFTLLAITFVIDLGDTMLKGGAYIHSLGIEYLFRNCILFVLCLIAIRVRNVRFHAALVILFILYELSWIFRLYYVI